MASAILQRATAKVSRRLVWFLAMLYFLAILDRVNIGFAASGLNRALGLNAEQFGFGAGLFFFGYLVFEVPSNLALARFGARRWIARIMVTWGLCSTAVIFAQGPISFYVLRFLLGAAEAGFFPGVIWFLANWFPAAARARMNALFVLGLPLSNATASAISGPILGLDGVAGLGGWQWLLLLEGAPTIMVGVITWFYLTDTPRDATWLSAEERAALISALAAEPTPGARMTLWQAMVNPTLWILGLSYLGTNVGLVTLGLWLPQIVSAMGLGSAVVVGLVSAVILLVGAVVMALWARHSDRQGERVWHAVLAAALAAAGWLICAASADPAVRFTGLIVAASGTYAVLSVFWTLPTAMLSGRASAGGVALVGSLGSIGGFLGPWMIGALRQGTGGFSAALLVVSACMILAGGAALIAGRRIFGRAGD